MNQEKIGIIIRKIRKDSGMSQKEFAKKYGVTFQAVSKWENGLNIPDIAIIKQICSDYNLDISNFLDAKSKKNKRKVFLFIIIFLLLVVIIYLIFGTKNSFEFKTITASCDDFTVSGSMAYNDKKSSIYISHVEYCGGNDDKKYEKIECELKAEDGNTSYLIEKCLKVGNNVTLEQYLKDITFNIDKQDNTCSRYAKGSIFLAISAKDSKGKITNYSIPLELSNNCE